MSDPSRQLKSLFVKEKISFDLELNLQTLPELINYEVSDQTIEEFDQSRAYEWFMPQEYKNLDIAKWVLDQCKTDAELQRAGEELIMFQERNMFILLQYLKYLVDTMRENNIVWGVGRGSSIASFVLYLIGIHRINSLYYDLSINEFLK
jgi:DNA polymerase III alpha subunit